MLLPMRPTTVVLLFAVGIGSAQGAPHARSRAARPSFHSLIIERSHENESRHFGTAAHTLEHSLDLIRAAYDSLPTEVEELSASADLESIASKVRSERCATVIHKIRSACVSALDSGTALLKGGIAQIIGE
jgi:hypothetical protein